MRRFARLTHPTTLVAALTLAAAAAPLHGQEAVGRDSAGPDPLAGIDGTALRAGSWRYSATVTRAGASLELARRTLSLLPTTHEGVAAWLVLERTEARGQTTTDSLVVRRADLRPLHRVAGMGPLHLVLDFRGDSAVGTMTVPGEEGLYVAAASERTLVANSGMLEAALRLLPLRAGWTGTIAQLTLGPGGASVVPVTLAVTGEDTVAVPAGRFAAWVVTATAAGATQRLWVARDGGTLVRQEATPPHATDVTYETVLLAPAVPPAASGVP